MGGRDRTVELVELKIQTFFKTLDIISFCDIIEEHEETK